MNGHTLCLLLLFRATLANAACILWHLLFSAELNLEVLSLLNFGVKLSLASD